jgi:cell division protein FtsZ
MVFIAAGMGGGTGTGAAPVVARAAKERGILTVAVITKPFQFEGLHRFNLAEAGIEDLEQFVDTLIVIPNQNLFRVANEKTTFSDAFNMADEVLYSGVRGVTDLMVMPGLINLDFADIRSVISEMGKAMMGTGEAEGERRALDAAEAAISNPLLDDCSMAGAKGVLINITGSHDMTLFEADEAANRIRSEVDVDAYIIFGSTFDDSLAGKIRVSVVATGMDREPIAVPAPTFLSVSSPLVQPQEVKAPSTDDAPELMKFTASDSIEDPEKVEPMSATTPVTVDAEILEEINLEIPSAESVRETQKIFAAEELMQEDTKPKDAVVEEEVPTNEAAAHSKFEETEENKEAIMDQGKPAPATPGHNMEDAFIPEAPICPTGEKAPDIADPFAAAAMTNGSKNTDIKPKASAPKAKKQSLFERVTGLAGSTGDVAEAVAFEAKVAIPPLSPVSKPITSSINIEEKVQLGGMDEAERLASSQGESDLLDIPAFLRRQAN